jgi:hypothetical protein
VLGLVEPALRFAVANAGSNHSDTLESIVMATQTLPPRPSYVLLTLAQREAR